MGFGQRLEEDSLQHGQLKDPGDPNNQKTNSEYNNYYLKIQKYTIIVLISTSSDYKKS